MNLVILRQNLLGKLKVLRKEVFEEIRKNHTPVFVLQYETVTI